MDIKKRLHEGVMLENRIKYNLELPNDVKLINDVFKNKGFELYVVGGSIRDALVNKAPKDWDLATNASPEDIIKLLKPQSFITKIIETGKSFGVINVLTSNDEYEIATFRGDGEYSDGRHPDNIRFGDIRLDTARRDLTINALYYDINTKEIIDMVGGVDDIKNGVIRTVGIAGERFGEDKLRILRAIRFAARFGKQLSDDIKDSLRKDNDLSGVSPERVRDEFLKGIKTALNVVYFLRLLYRYDLFKFIFKGLYVDVNLFTETKQYKVLIALLLNKNKNISKQLNKLTYSSNEVKDIDFLLKLLTFSIDKVYEYKKALNNTTLTLNDLVLFASKIGLDVNMIKALGNFKLTVTGADLQKQGIKPGPEMGAEMRRQEVERFKKFL